MYKKTFIAGFFFILTLFFWNEAKAVENPKGIKVYIALDNSVKELGITSPQVSGKVSVSLLQKGFKPVFIDEREAKYSDHMRIDLSARKSMVWITISYIKIFKFKYGDETVYKQGIEWSNESNGYMSGGHKNYLDYIDNLINSYITTHYNF